MHEGIEGGLRGRGEDSCEGHLLNLSIPSGGHPSETWRARREFCRQRKDLDGEKGSRTAGDNFKHRKPSLWRSLADVINSVDGTDDSLIGKGRHLGIAIQREGEPGVERGKTISTCVNCCLFKGGDGKVTSGGEERFQTP